MISQPLYWRNKSEAELASYQQLQVGNSCAQNAIAAAFNLFFNARIDGNHLSTLVNQTALPDRIRYRLWSNGPTTPLNQLHLLMDIALHEKHPISIQLEKGSPSILRQHLSQTDSLTLVTIGWLPGSAPVITRGVQPVNLNAARGFGFHVMIAAAYDPAHADVNHIIRPWGFINSWSSGGSELFWMTDDDFNRSWRFYTPFGGTYPMVTIQINRDKSSDQ